MNDAPDTHDPPALDTPLNDDAVLIPCAPVPVADAERTVEHRRVATASDRYLLLAQRLHDDPMNVVKRMVTGRYRYKRRRNDHLWVENGQPVRELMSLRQASVELERITGEDVSHETLRRWWARVWPQVPVPDGPAGARGPIPDAVFLAPPELPAADAA